LEEDLDFQEDILVDTLEDTLEDLGNSNKDKVNLEVNSNSSDKPIHLASVVEEVKE
jgi:hypothetical protein